MKNKTYYTHEHILQPYKLQAGVSRGWSSIVVVSLVVMVVLVVVVIVAVVAAVARNFQYFQKFTLKNYQVTNKF